MIPVDYFQNNNWYPSVGEKLGFTHFRNNHYHAECSPMTRTCSVHYDEVDPYESFGSLVKHMWQSNLGKIVLIGIGLYALKRL